MAESTATAASAKRMFFESLDAKPRACSHCGIAASDRHTVVVHRQNDGGTYDLVYQRDLCDVCLRGLRAWLDEGTQ